MPKKLTKQKKKDRKQNTGAPKPPSLLVPSSPAVPTASTSGRDIAGLPKTPGGELGDALEGFSAGTVVRSRDDGSSEPVDIPARMCVRGHPNRWTRVAHLAKTREAALTYSTTGASSTHSSPPHDAAAVLAALASKSPRHPSPRPHSPRPPTTTAREHSPSAAYNTSPTTQIRHTRADSHARQGSDASLGRPSSIQTSSSAQAAPTLVRSGKGIAFMPSASHFLSAQPTIDTGADVTSSSPKPPMSRTASGAAREIVEGEAGRKGKGVVRSGSQGSLKSLAAATTGQKAHTEGPTGHGPTSLEQDPVSEAQVNKMMQTGTIEVGVMPETPDTVSPDLVEEGADTLTAADGTSEVQEGHNREVDDGAAYSTSNEGDGQSKTDRSERILPKSPSVVPKKRDADDETADDEDTTSEEPSALLRSKKRSFLRLPDDEVESKDGKVDSEDERVLNEVSHEESQTAHTSGAVSRSTTPGPDQTTDAKQHQPEQQPSERYVTLYTPPYKTRKPYKPVSLSNTSNDTGLPLSISLFAAVTRHHEVPYAASRRLEVRLAWREPSTWVWIPGRKYVPDWKLDYVARRVEDGIVRKTVKGVLGYTPVLWRLAEWI